MDVTRCTTDMNTLVRHLEGSLNPRLAQTTLTHLENGCDRCNQRIAWLERIARTGGRHIASRVVAMPIPDPRLGSVPMALRGKLADVRQRLFLARSDIRVDVQIEEANDGSFVLEGQIMVFGAGGRNAQGARTSIYKNGNLISETRASEIGEFEFAGLAFAGYDLVMEVEQTCVIVPELEI